MKTKRFLSILLSLVLVLGMLPGMSLTASAADTTTTITSPATTGTMTITLTIAAASVKTAVAATVTANNRTYDGSEKPLVNVDNSTLVGGEMQYALGTATEATQPYTTAIPTATDAGTYYVWYKVIASEDYLDSEPVCIVVTISKEAEPEQKNVLVVKNKIRITNLFSKYGESGYKYKFKVEDKSQRKIASVTKKGKISVKKVGSVKVSLFRKAKKGKWEKVEEQTVKTELPAVTKRITDLKVGDTLEASSFITNQSELLNKPTSYKSTNKKVATVDSTTGKITILKKGNTRIRIIYGTGNGSAVYTTRLRVK